MWAAIFVGIFLVIMVGLGWWTKKFVSSSSDFLLAGREMSWGVNMMGVVASGFAGTTISLAPAYVIMFGFLGLFLFSSGYAFLGIVLYGLLFARTIRRSGAYTLPEWLEMRFDYRVRRVLSITGIIGMIAVTANNVLALANVISGYFGISLYVSIAIGVITFLAFTLLSGMWGVSMTDFLQALLGCVGAPLLLIACIKVFGGVGDTIQAWNGTFVGGFLNAGITGNSMPMTSLSYPSLLTIALNFGIFLVWGGNHYWMRMAGARNEKQARNGYVVGGILLMMITVLIGMVGLYSGAYFGTESTMMGGTVAPAAAYGHLINHFPAAIGAFLLLFALAASLSTAASTLMGAVNLAVKDIYPSFINKKPREEQLKRVAKISTVLIAAMAWGLAFYPGGTTFLFAFATAWMAPAGLMFALGMFWRRCTSTGAFIGALCALIAQSIWCFLDVMNIPVNGAPIASYFHMSVLGIIAGIIPAIIVSLLTKPKYYGRSGWTRQASKS